MKRKTRLARVVPIVKPCKAQGSSVAQNRIPYFRFYPSDFMRGVRGLSAQEIGLYTMLLCRMYEESGPIENHTLRLATYSGMRMAAFEKTLEKLVQLGKIVRQDGVLFNSRAQSEISNRADDLNVAIKAGKASAEKRQQNQEKHSTPVQRPFNHTDTDTDTDTEEREAIASCAKVDHFPDFWDAYPHRNGAKKNRKGADAAFSKALKIATPEQIAAGVEMMRNAPDVLRGFTRDPTTWLNQMGWTDEIQPSSGYQHDPRNSPASKPGPNRATENLMAGFAAVAARNR